MRDGVRLAIDVHLPDRRSGPLPTIVRQTRYFRGVQLRRLFRHPEIEFLLDHAATTRDRFLANGFAWVDVCARGSGASFGQRPCPWAPDETADGFEVLDWIVAQPWSNGRVGSTGVSYDGTSAEMLATTNHPALKAIVPRFSLYDVYTDVAFPGGIHLDWFTAAWASFNRALDEGALDRAFAAMLRVQLRAWRSLAPGRSLLGRLLATLDRDGIEAPLARVLRLVASGVRPVDGDRDRALLAAALAAHRDNFDVNRGALAVDFRDDMGMSDVYPQATIDFFSPHAKVDELRSSRVAIYGYSGWLDAAYQHGAIKRFGAVRNPGSRLIVGPWDHGGLQNVSPHSPSTKAAFDHGAEMIRFFDAHLRPEQRTAADDPAVRYYTMGEERWKQAEDWPPVGAQVERWYLGEGGALRPQPDRAAGVDEYRVDPDVGSGRRSRWDSLLGLLVPVGYSGRAALGRRLLVYRGAPLDADLEVTGHPLLTLHLASSTRDATLFAYLEDERPDGQVDYVTEGQLRALHRRPSSVEPPYPQAGPYRSFLRADAAPLEPGVVSELSFDLLPTSWLFRRGHRLRLALAGADCDHFERLPDAPTLAVQRGGGGASFLALPVMRPRSRA